MSAQSITPFDLSPLEHYLVILAEEYPRSITSSELAHRAGVSRPAVSKIRSRLMRICQEDEMLYKRRFLLKDDTDTIWALGYAFGFQGHLKAYLRSRYLLTVLNIDRAYRLISDRFPLYGRYFLAEDTGFIIGKLLEMASNVEPIRWRALLKSMTEKRPQAAASQFVEHFAELLAGLRFTVNSREELQRIFIIRDRLFLLVRDYVWAAIERMEIIVKLDSRRRPVYMEVYKHTADFYLRRIFEWLNNPIIQAARESSLPVESKMLAIGATTVERV